MRPSSATSSEISKDAATASVLRSAPHNATPRSPLSSKLVLAVLSVFALVTVAFTAQAAGIAGISFDQSQTFVVLVDGKIEGNYREFADAQDAAGAAKVANPNAYVGYFGTEFFEVQIDVVPPTPVPPTPVPPTPVPPTPVPGSELPTRLLGPSDFEYEGSFTVPDGVVGREGSLRYVGTGLAYNPARNSLFITGHDWFQLTAEISIPEPAIQANIADLPRASFIRTPEDVTDGRLSDQQDTPDVNQYSRVGGYLVDGDQLVVSAYQYYDAGNEQVRSHLMTDINLGPAGEMISISNDVPARWLGGSMAHIPEQWQASFGGDPWMTGLSGVNIVSRTSAGPSAATFSPATFQGNDPAELVLGYPLAEALGGPPESQSDLYNLTSQPRGIVFPVDTASVLYFGVHGTGPYCYGIRDNCGGETYRNGPSPHADPYRNQMWAYDAADLVAVYNGERTPQSLRPYFAGAFDLPYDHEFPEIVGVAYDDVSGRIFLTQTMADATRPIIHVYTVR